MAAKFRVSEQTAIARVIARLTEAFAPVVPGHQIDETVRRIHRRFEASKIRDFVPLLVENAARNELRARSRGRASGPSDDPPEPTRAGR